jgi:hypothetical protein
LTSESADIQLMRLSEKTERMDFAQRAQWLGAADMARWDEFVFRNTAGLIFQTSKWKNILEAAFPHIRGNVLAVCDSASGEIRAGIPIYSVRSWLLGTRLVSIPFASVCDALVSSEEDFAELVPHLFEQKPPRAPATLEIRASRSGDVLLKNGFAKTSSYKHHYIRVDKPLDALLSSFSQTAIRRMLSKGVKAGITVRSDFSEQGLHEFYSLFLLSRKRLRLPPIPIAFFSAIRKELGPEHSAIFVATKDSQPIGAMIAVRGNGAAFLEYSGEAPEARNSGVNQLLIWEGIKFSQMNGDKTVSLGRTAPNNDGLLRYKRHWGSVEEDLPFFTIGKQAPSSRVKEKEKSFSYRTAQWLAARSPLPVCKLLGKFCYSHWG